MQLLPAGLYMCSQAPTLHDWHTVRAVPVFLQCRFSYCIFPARSSSVLPLASSLCSPLPGYTDLANSCLPTSAPLVLLSPFPPFSNSPAPNCYSFHCCLVTPMRRITVQLSHIVPLLIWQLSKSVKEGQCLSLMTVLTVIFY